MKHRRLTTAIIATLILLGSMGIGLRASSRDVVPAGALSSQTAVGTAFTYQGRLTDEGRPANGEYDLQFELHDDPTADSQVGSIIGITKVITDGLFTVELDFGSGAFDGDARWLEVHVREAGSAGGFTQLLPRQELTPAPYALYVEHDHLGETWTGSDNPLTINGTFTSTGTLAPLVLANSGPYGLLVDSANLYGVVVDSTGNDGLRVFSAGDDGLAVTSAGGNGVWVNTAAEDGVSINSAGDDGVVVGEAGNPSTTFATSDKAGVEVQGAEGYGMYVGRADVDGVHVNSANDDGVQVTSANYGLYVASSNVHGILVQNPDADGDGLGKAGVFNGDVDVFGNLVASSKSFVIDHPQNPEEKYLYHASMESPERTNVYHGNVILDGEGEAWVELPDYFEALNRDFRYQLTPIGAPGPNLYVAEEIQGNRFKIGGGSPGMKVSWQVTGIRDDAYARENPMEVEVEKPDHEQGLYLHPELYGKPSSLGIGGAERGAAE